MIFWQYKICHAQISYEVGIIRIRVVQTLDADTSDVQGSPRTSAIRHAFRRVVQADGMAGGRLDAFGQRLSDVIFPKNIQSDNPNKDLFKMGIC
jgi:hypothetical protein